jgi:hypothetical protein
VLGISVLLSTAAHPVVDAFLFGLGQPVEEIVRWASLALVTGISFLLLRLLEILSGELARHSLFKFARRYLEFLALFYCVVGVHYLLLTRHGWSGDSGDLLQLPLLEIVLVSLVSGLTWPLALDLFPWRRVARQVFATSALGLTAYLFVREPLARTELLVCLGLLEPPRFGVGGYFSLDLAFVAPLPPLVWTTWRGWRETRRDPP